MKKRKVWRYTCEFCGKSNCSGASISSHEKYCTRNPNRVCRMCIKSIEVQEPINDLITALGEDIVKSTKSTIDIKSLREKSNNCPACILAAIRQINLLKFVDIHNIFLNLAKKSSLDYVNIDFNFKNESAAKLAEWRELEKEEKLEITPW